MEECISVAMIKVKILSWKEPPTPKVALHAQDLDFDDSNQYALFHLWEVTLVTGLKLEADRVLASCIVELLLTT